METYVVQNSFWVQSGSKINWDADKDGREGVGIPFYFVNKNRKQKVKIIVADRGAVFVAKMEKLVAHHKTWRTLKTAPRGTTNKFIIVPTAIMEFIGWTEEKQKKMDALIKKETDEKKPNIIQEKLFLTQ